MNRTKRTREHAAVRRLQRAEDAERVEQQREGKARGQLALVAVLEHDERQIPLPLRETQG